MTAIGVIVALIVAVVGVAAGYFIGYNNRKKTAEAQIGSAEAEATRLVNEAIKTADQKRKEAVLEAKDEAFRLKAEVDPRASSDRCSGDPSISWIRPPDTRIAKLLRERSGIQGLFSFGRRLFRATGRELHPPSFTARHPVKPIRYPPWSQTWRRAGCPVRERRHGNWQPRPPPK